MAKYIGSAVAKVALQAIPSSQKDALASAIAPKQTVTAHDPVNPAFTVHLAPAPAPSRGLTTWFARDQPNQPLQGLALSEHDARILRRVQLLVQKGGPGAGAITCYIVFRVACEVGLPDTVQAQMLANIAVVGSATFVPIAGTFIDEFFRANQRNALLLESFLITRRRDQFRVELGHLTPEAYQAKYPPPRLHKPKAQRLAQAQAKKAAKRLQKGQSVPPPAGIPPPHPGGPGPGGPGPIPTGGPPMTWAPAPLHAFPGGTYGQRHVAAAVDDRTTAETTAAATSPPLPKRKKPAGERILAYLKSASPLAAEPTMEDLLAEPDDDEERAIRDRVIEARRDSERRIQQQMQLPPPPVPPSSTPLRSRTRSSPPRASDDAVSTWLAEQARLRGHDVGPVVEAREGEYVPLTADRRVPPPDLPYRAPESDTEAAIPVVMPYLAATPLDPPVQSSARAWLDSIGISQLAVSKFLSKARSGAVTPRSDVATRGGDDVRTSYGEPTYTGGMASLSASSGSSVDADEVDDDAMVEPPDTLLPPMFDERSESPRSGSPSLPHRPPPVHSATPPPLPFRHAS